MMTYERVDAAEAPRIVALVLAAGLSTRFGGDKLVHPYRGKPLAAHIADVIAAMPVAHRLAICPSENAARQKIFRDRGFDLIGNDNPGVGLSSSLALGAARAIELAADVLIVCLADMPHVTADYLALLAGECGAAAAIVASQTAAARHPPVAFARPVFDRLLTLEGDAGARPLLAAAKVLPMPIALAADFDTREDFAEAPPAQA